MSHQAQLIALASDPGIRPPLGPKLAALRLSCDIWHEFQTFRYSNARKKQSSSMSAAGRKIARKQAHSLIERRRRSKINEEFGVLMDMIPACTGEMHKLAILQVSDNA
jgi:hypothetical protein